MSQGLQSPGGRAATDSAAQSGSIPLRAAPAGLACSSAAQTHACALSAGEVAVMVFRGSDEAPAQVLTLAPREARALAHELQAAAAVASRPDAGADAAAAAGPVDPARVRLAVTALCDIAHLTQQASMLAAELYGYEGDGRALVLQVLGERIDALASCACTLLDDPAQPLDELEQVVLSSRRQAEGGAA